MKISFIKGMLIALAIPFSFMGCDDDEPKPAGVSFEETELTVFESDGTTTSFHPLVWESFSGSTGATGREIQVKLSLTKALPQTAVISYSLSGTAKKNSPSTIGDFDTDNQVTIEKGATEAFITITLFEDLELELKENSTSESIVITLEEVVSGPAKLGEQTTFTLTVEEDDTLILLFWEDESVDMDLFLWLEDEYLTASAQAGGSIEGVYIPAGFPNGTYGMSYTYYSGESDNLAFTSSITNFGGNLGTTTGTDGLEFNSTYKLVNKNRYDAEDHVDFKGEPRIVQTMEKNGLNYTSISQIAPPTEGSRLNMNSVFRNRLKLQNTKFLQYKVQ